MDNKQQKLKQKDNTQNKYDVNLQFNDKNYYDPNIDSRLKDDKIQYPKF